MNKSPELQAAIKAVKEGGKIALSYYNSDLEVTHKSDNTMVTHADLETEKEIKEEITSSFSGAKFVGEETGGEFNDSSPKWVVDPIDGTACFVRNIPTWSVVVGYFDNGEFILGAAYFPAMDLLIYGEKGNGSNVNETKISVSKTQELSQAFLCFTSIRRFTNIELLTTVASKSSVARGYDSGYMGYLLASGKIDAIIRGENESIWDLGPFIPIITEAGGKVTDYDGNPANQNSKGMILTNGLIQDEILDIVNSQK